MRCARAIAPVLVLALLAVLTAAACGTIEDISGLDLGGAPAAATPTSTPDLPATIQALISAREAEPATPPPPLSGAPPSTPMPATLTPLPSASPASVPPPLAAPTFTARATPTPPAPTATPSPLAGLSSGEWVAHNDPDTAAAIHNLPWIADGVSPPERAAAQELVYLAADHPDLLRELVARPWVADGIDQPESAVIERIADIADHDAALAHRIADLPWIRDGVAQPEPGAVESLYAIAYHDVALAYRIIELPWAKDDIEQVEENVIQTLYYIADDDAELAGAVVDLAWVADGVAQVEKNALSTLFYIADDAVALARQIISLPWVANGIDADELSVVKNIGYIANDDAALAARVVAMPWFADGVTGDESDIVDTIGSIANSDAALAGQIVNLAWLADGITAAEVAALANLHYIAYDHAPLAKQVAAMPWFADDISADDNVIVDNLGYIADLDAELAGNIVNMPFLATLEPADAVAVASLGHLAYFNAPVFRQVMSHPTLRAGINDRWAGIVATLSGVSEVNPALIDTLLDPQRVTMERRAIALPRSGSVDLAVIRTGPGAGRSIDLLEHSVRSAEMFMDEPLPTNYVALLFENAVSGSSAGTNFATHIAARPRYDVDDGSQDAEFAGHLIAHEVAHYYWNHGVDWVDEGAADLMASISERSRIGAPVEITNPPCDYADSIAALERLDARDADVFDCNYALGERFFLSLYRSIGDAAFRQGFRRLYLMAQVEDDDDDYAGTAVGIGHLREAFQHSEAGLNAVIARWYDGTSSDGG